MSVVERIEEYRKKNGFTYSELARKIGISPDALSEWERGKATPSQRSLAAVQSFLGALTDLVAAVNDKNAANAAASAMVDVLLEEEKRKVVRGRE